MIHLFLLGDCSTVPRSPLKRGNGGTVWTLLSVVFRAIVRNSCGTAEQLDIGSPRLDIVGIEVALITIKILLTILAIGQSALGN